MRESEVKISKGERPLNIIPLSIFIFGFKPFQVPLSAYRGVRLIPCPL